LASQETEAGNRKAVGKGWWNGSSGTVPAHQVWGAEYKPQHHQKKKKKSCAQSALPPSHQGSAASALLYWGDILSYDLWVSPFPSSLQMADFSLQISWGWDFRLSK
jgi:hypothetical protein